MTSVASISPYEPSNSKRKAAGKRKTNGENINVTLFEKNLDGILLIKPDGIVLAANPQMRKMLGMTEEEVKKSGWDGIVEKNSQLTAGRTKEKHEDSTRVECTFRRKDGTTFEGGITSNLFIDADGTTKSCMIVRDITNCKKNENFLLEKTRINQILLDAFPCVAILLHPNTREIVACNRLAAQAGAVIGKQCFRTWAKRETPCTFCRAPIAWKTGGGQYLEVESLGTYWAVHWIPISEDLYFHFAFDITEYKKTEQSLRENEEKYRSLFKNTQNGFVYCEIVNDNSGKPSDFVYLEVNDAFEKLSGIHKADIVGKRSSEIHVGIRETNPEFFEVFTRVATTGNTEEFETFVKGLNVWLSVKAYSQKKGFFAAIIENITEQKLDRQKLEDYSQGLELTIAARTQELTETHEHLLKAERFAAIGELAGMVGHDLRNPLTSIKNAAYYLNRKLNTSMDAKEKTMFDVIDKSVDHANKIIGNLLEYSKEISLEIEECTPKSLVDYVLLMTQIPDHVKVHDHTYDQPTLWVDSNKMERVFINLIKNASDAMPNGGTIEIASRHVGDSVEFTFADTGTGMSEQTKAKIFTPLFTTKAQGMGFGLAICKRIVEAHCGKIGVESTFGKGTKFTIVLPIEQEFKIRGSEEFEVLPLHEH